MVSLIVRGIVFVVWNIAVEWNIYLPRARLRVSLRWEDSMDKKNDMGLLLHLFIGLLHSFAVPFLGASVLLFYTSFGFAQEDADFYDDPFINEYPDENIEPIMEEDFGSDMPFQPRKKSRANADDDKGNSKSGGDFGKTNKDSTQDRFGQPKNKIVFRLVDDEKIKESLQKGQVSNRPLTVDEKTEANMVPPSGIKIRQ